MGASQVSLVQTQDKDVNQLQSNIAQVLNPIAKNPLVVGSALGTIDLVVGNNTVNTGLNRDLQGWLVTDINAASSIYKISSDSKTIVLNSSAICTISLYVF